MGVYGWSQWNFNAYAGFYRYRTVAVPEVYFGSASGIVKQRDTYQRIMKKIIELVFLVLLLSTSSYADNIKDFKIEKISIGHSALEYFTESQLEGGELDWFNYSYKEYSTSLLPGQGIYDWFKISYKSEDDKFIIEGLVGIVLKKIMMMINATKN